MRINGLFDGGSQRSYVSKRVLSGLPLKIINKERIEINVFNSNNFKKKFLDYCELFLKFKKGNQPINAFFIALIWLPLKINY